MARPIWRLLFVVALFVSGCTGAVQPAAGPEADGGEVFLIALPRIVVDINSEGEMVIFGLNLAEAASFFGMNPASFMVGPSLPASMQQAGIQHIELLQRGDAIVPFVNGLQMPYIVWDDGSLNRALDLAEAFDVQNTALLRQAVPILRRLGLDVVARFPLQDGVAEAPLGDPAQVAATPPAPSADQQAYMILMAEIKYDEQGVPAILGISAADLVSAGINAPLGLTEDMLQRFQANNFQNLEVALNPGGLTLYLNGEPLPGIVWDENILNNVTQTAMAFRPEVLPEEWFAGAVDLLGNSDINFLAHFPVAEGQEAIPAQMHTRTAQ